MRFGRLLGMPLLLVAALAATVAVHQYPRLLDCIANRRGGDPAEDLLA